MALLIFKPQNLASYLHFGQRDSDTFGILNANYSTEKAAQELLEKGDLILLKENLEDSVTFENVYDMPKEECAAVDLSKHDLSEKVERFIFDGEKWEYQAKSHN